MNGSTGLFTHSPSVATGKKEAISTISRNDLNYRFQPKLMVHKHWACGLFLPASKSFSVDGYSSTKTQVNFEMAVFLQFTYAANSHRE